MRILSIIQPSEMGSDFRFDEEAGLWKVNFPAGMGEGGGVPLSTDANNAIGLGTDEGAFISTDLLGAYALTQDNASKKINLYRFPAGTEFNPETATLVSSVNMVELSGIFDDVAIDGDVITFTDADTGLTLSLDTANLQKVSDIVGSDAISVSSIDGETRIEVRINPDPNNLIQLSEGGLVVNPYDLGGGDLDLHQTLAQVEDGLCHVVGNSHLVVPQIELVDVAGNPIGYINDIIGLPVSSETHGPDHCPKWEAPTANNCRVGKVAVAFVPDLIYGFNPEEPSIEWRVFFNGEDTGYIAAAPQPELASVIDQPMLMSLTQEDFGDATDFIGRDYLEEIISNATNGAISGSYEDGVSLLNETNQQVILTLVPNKPISLDSIRNVYNAGDGASIFGLTLDEITAVRNGDNLEAPPTVENLEDYFDEETGVLSICLAPNGSGNGGSTGPQISCDGATDRFATSGLWYNWTVKLNGETLVQNGESGQVIEALENSGIRVGYNGEMETTYRNMTNENIRLELIAGQPNNSWDQIYLEIDKSTNPTLMGYDPIQNNAEAAMMALGPLEESQEPERYQRITVCLAPANDWMDWKYAERDSLSARVTLTNSIKLADANLDYRVEGEPDLEVEVGNDKWGDITWDIYANSPLRTEVTLTITHPDYTDEYTVDFFARKPMVLTLANPHEYARETIITSSLEGNSIEITSVEVVGSNGTVVISNPEDGMLIDAVHGAVRFDDLENGKFSYVVKGLQFATGISDNIKVKFVTDLGVEEVVEHTFRADDIDGFLAISSNLYSKITVGIVDTQWYSDIRELPKIGIESPDWGYNSIQRVNEVGGQTVLEFDFAQQPTYTLKIHAYLSGAKLAVIGDCVVGVDDWGDVEADSYTFNRETYEGLFNPDNIDFTNISKNNLSYVPAEGVPYLQTMTGMFAGTDLSDPSVDLSAYAVNEVYSMAGVFAHSNFNGNIVGWNTRWVQRLDYAFYGSKFRQDLSLWCVPSITEEPTLFSHRSPLLAKHKPVWGTCPLIGNSNERGEVLLYNEGGYAHNYASFGLPNDFIAEVEPRFTNEGLITEVKMYSPMRYFGVRSLKDQAITNVELDDGMVLIDAQALMNNRLNSVTVPSTMKVIGTEAFAGNPMTAITLLGDVPPSLGTGALPETVTEIVMSDEAITAYSKHKDWKQYVGKLKPFSESVGVLYKDTAGKLGFLAGPVIAEDALSNSQVYIESINDGVIEIQSDALAGNYAHAVTIPNSVTTVGGSGLNFSAQILEFEEGRVDTAFMVDSRPDANVVILPSTMTELTGWVIGNVPRVIVSKAAVPPTLGVWDAYSWNANNIEYRSSLGSWYSYSGTGCEALYVPAGSIEAYRADPRWTMYTTNILPLDELDYGNVKKIKMTASGSDYQVNGTADLASVGKEVTIRYYESLYNSNTGRNVPTNVLSYSATVGADGTFNVNVPVRDTLANHYIDAVIGAGNLLVTNSYA